MNDNAVALIFILVFGVTAWWAGAGWQRKRMIGDLEDLYERVYGKAYDRATSRVFQTAVRATARTGNGAVMRYLPRAAGRAAVARCDNTGPAATLAEDTTVVIPIGDSRHASA